MKSYYDELFYNEEGMKQYYEFVKNHAKGETLIEMACGTGDLLNLLEPDFELTCVDIDVEMLEQIPVKYPNLKAELIEGDFLNFNNSKRYDTAVCIGDSTNYILTKEDLEQFVKTMTSLSDCVIVDCHHPSRLKEFANDYYEEGSLDSFDYAYQIEVNEEHLVHVINFLDGTFDAIYQWVFDPQLLIDLFKKYGYWLEVYTDHKLKGIQKEGEKVVIVAHKG